MLHSDDELPPESAGESLAQAARAPRKDVSRPDEHAIPGDPDREPRCHAPSRAFEEIIGEQQGDRRPVDQSPFAAGHEGRELVEIDALLVGGMQNGSDAGHLGLRPGEVGPRDARVFALVDHVVHFAAERIERGDRGPPLTG